MATPHERRSDGTLDDQLELLQELEGNTSDEIIRQRAWSRIQVKSKVVVQPGNTSEVRSLKIAGVTGDISSGGCQVLLPVPLQVGDNYRITFDRTSLDLPMAFARCVRCRLIREDAFESGLSFYQAVELDERTVKDVSAREAA